MSASSGTRVYFGSELPEYISEQHVREHFSRFEPHIVSIELVCDEKTQDFGFITFSSFSSAQLAVKDLDNSTLLGKHKIKLNIDAQEQTMAPVPMTTLTELPFPMGTELPSPIVAEGEGVKANVPTGSKGIDHFSTLVKSEYFAEITETVNHTFLWNGSGKEIFLVGSFNNWKKIPVTTSDK